MQYFIYTFFKFTLVAALLGFSGLFAISVGIAQICFYFFAALFVISMITHSTQKKKRVNQ